MKIADGNVGRNGGKDEDGAERNIENKNRTTEERVDCEFEEY